MATERVIRDAGFARRLEQACDASFHCPPMHKGRLTWIAAEMSKRLKADLSVQTVARWMNGEAKPRQEKNTKLAELLGVDSVWLYLGIQKHEMPKKGGENPEAAKAANELADAAACLLELHDASGLGNSHTAMKLRRALEAFKLSA